MVLTQGKFKFHYEFLVDAQEQEAKWEEMVRWCKETFDVTYIKSANCNGWKALKIINTFCFANENDAVLFMLKWSQ